MAEASGPPHSPALTLRVDRTARVTVLRRGRASRFAFSGPGGSWLLRIGGRGHDATTVLRLDDDALAHLLALLEGGQLRLENGSRPVTMLLPDAGISGRDWIGCATGKKREARSAAG